MEPAVISARAEGYWTVTSAGDRRYFLQEHQIVGSLRPFIGQTGQVGYVQGASSLVLTFVVDEGLTQ